MTIAAFRHLIAFIRVPLLLLQLYVLLSARPIIAAAAAAAQADDSSNNNNFAEVNEILKNVAVKLPDVPAMESNGYSIDLSNIVCTEISINDISLTNRILTSTDTTTTTNTGQGSQQDKDEDNVQIQLNLNGLDFICNAEYEYRGLLGMINRGDVYLYSTQNYVTATATIGSTGGTAASTGSGTGSNNLPTNIVMNNCNPTVQIRDVDFSNGGFIGWILDAIEGVLRTAMENLASVKICSTLQTMLEVDGNEFLKYISNEVLSPYLLDVYDEPAIPGIITSSSNNPLEYESEFVSKLILDTAKANVYVNVNAANTSNNTSIPIELQLLNLR
jgi:hypothetical protein